MRLPKTKKLTSTKRHKFNSKSLHDHILKLQDEFDALEEILSLLHEVSNQWLSGELELSTKNKNGLVSLLDIVTQESVAFHFRLNQLNQNPLERFNHMVLRHPTLVKYFDKKRGCVNLEMILEDYPDMSQREKVMTTFMLMVWNEKQKFPKTKPYRILEELQHLDKAERQLIVDWASDPFYVNDGKGRLIHRR